MSKFSKGKWRADYEENKYIWSSEGEVLGELYFTTPEETKANARLIAAAPEMYELLKEELVPTSDYGGIVSFERERKIKELLARIDGEERTLDEISKDMKKLLREAYKAGKEETRVISKRAFCEWLRNNREKIEKMLNEEEGTSE